ncbi:nonribosomal polyketide synthase protein [Candidatus Scalindua japonica]|uniref:Nonribosomal polyketide synthase protein n=1 Tax=Candidatus Scalindua japonica TaxID=1284222 RepID=A0A286TWN7_9BACT|nr:non-ribosomal peptide synthetase [Candidatus Scalindua japonica]GAX60251.1 nonribosomal polyketide synthase protein [Candidatus Scalindua japonica]
MKNRENNTQAVSRFDFNEGKRERSVLLEQDEGVSVKESVQLTVSATFTSEPVEDYIRWWCKQFDVDIAIQFAPYNQVFQELLDPSSLISTTDGVVLLLIRFEDWIRNDQTPDAERCKKIERNFLELTETLKNKKKSASYFVAVFPVSTHLSLSDTMMSYLGHMNIRWKKILKEIEDIHIIDFTELDRLYNIKNIFDIQKDETGHLPFSDEYYAAMGTIIARKIYSFRTQQFKVITLDCDNTLWKGVCGEDGALGVIIDNFHLELQKFILQKYNEGFLLVLCSKNNETDVWDVFENNPQMILKKEHFVNWRINWQAKSENIKELESELNLGKDSFIFIDDNPLECTEVMTNCPEVLTLQLPEDADQIPAYLKLAWAFDRFKVTREDKKRTSKYIAESKRRKAQEGVSSLPDFLKGLELKMSMNLVEKMQIARVSQLTQRTNQFNLSTIRRTEEEIESLINMPNIKCWVIEVTDRFGDYGLVGVVIIKEEKDKLFLDTFLLSCRVLGRRIEDAIMLRLKKYCKKQNLTSIEAKFYPTDKNKPFLDFIEREKCEKVKGDYDYIKYSLPINNIPDSIDFIECYYDSNFRTRELKNQDDIGETYQVDQLTLHKSKNNKFCKRNNWSLNIVNEENLLHRHHLIPIEYYTAKMLLGLPINFLRQFGKASASKLFNNFENASPGERYDLIIAYIRDLVVKVMVLDSSQLFDSQQSMMELGLDSLKAIELKNVLSTSLGVDIPLIDFLQNISVAHLAKKVLDQLPDSFSSFNHPHVSLPKIVPSQDQRYLPFPLTDMQQAYLIGRSGTFGLGKVACHHYVEVEKEGVDLGRVNHALQKLIERHDMLRAVILADGQQQIIKQLPSYQIDVLDLRGQDSKAIASRLEDIRQNMSHQLLPVNKCPLFEIRASLLNDQRTRFHISYDLMIGDIRSIQILIYEFSLLYNNPEVSLPPLNISFRDYVFAMVAFKDSGLYQQSLDYWRGRLLELPPAPELPLVSNPDSITSPRFIRRSGGLEQGTWVRLKNKASRAGITPSGILLAAFAEVLTTWSKSSEFSINLTLFNRHPLHSQVNYVVGDFTSTTILAIDNSVKDTFEVRARCHQNQLWKNLDYSYVSGVQVQRELVQASGDASMSTIPVVFTSGLGLGVSGQDNFALTGVVDMVYGISQTPQVWFDHLVYEETDALVFNWDVVDDLFPDGLIDDMFSAYCRFLQCLADDEKAWQEVTSELVPPDQLQQRVSVNTTEAPISNELLHTMFEKQVLLRPNQSSVVTSSKTLTYQELHQRSNKIGYKLREMDAKPNTLVAVVMEKGWEQVVAVLGILKSGAAYLPIDPGVPRERLWYLLEIAEIRFVLTHSRLDVTLEWPDNVKRFSLDKENIEGFTKGDLEPVQNEEDLAYVIFTSGSTGQPKGVMIDHRGAVNTIIDINQRFNVGHEDSVFAISELNFDLSVYDIFGLLSVGGTIVMPDASKKLEPSHWLELVTREKVSIWNSVPALMQMFVEHVSGQQSTAGLSSIQLVLMSGDWIPVTLPASIRNLIKGVKLISLGGATEASIWSILFPIEEVAPEWKSIPYGRPMKNQCFHVLSEMLEPCPMWVPGQLYIGGIGLAKGYWRDEEKTDKSFMTHPKTGERLYYTGDLGRYLPDGNIEFLGREDFQVKVQGYRIELEEIEVVLSRHPAVSSVVVTALGELSGNKRLVAYVVLNNGQIPTVNKHANAKDDKTGDFEVHRIEQVQLFDPMERLQFKLKEMGIHNKEGDKPYTQLIKPMLNENLKKVFTERRSFRRFLQEPITLEHFSEFLSCLLQIRVGESTFPKYRYGSAGGLYPVQTYIYIKPGRVDGLTGGTYYHHPIDHRLMLISANPNIDAGVYTTGNNTIFDESAFAVFFIGQLNAVYPMYGVLARDFCMLEAGIMSQLLETTAVDNQIGLCQIGGFDFQQIRHLFDLEESHVYLHSLVGGRVDQQIKDQSLVQEMSKSPSFVQSVQESKPDDDIVVELQRYLAEKLPEYMIPSSFVVIDSMPLTPNGKVDRKALSGLEGNLDSELEITDKVIPQTELERNIATIWKEVLGREEIGINDKLFDLGGNSIHIVQINNKLQKLLKRDIPMLPMFEYPTISSFAKFLGQEQSDEYSSQQGLSRGEARKLARKQRNKGL